MVGVTLHTAFAESLGVLKTFTAISLLIYHYFIAECPKGTRRCPGCRRKKCIRKEKFCDGVPDCRGGTDEDPKYCSQLPMLIAFDVVIID